jgi:hypothetical protein
LKKIQKKLVILRLFPNILESYYFIKLCRKDPNFILFFLGFVSKNGLNLDFSGSGLPHHGVSFVKKLFLSFYPPRTDSFLKIRRFSSFLVLYNKGATWLKNGHFRGPTGGFLKLQSITRDDIQPLGIININHWG